MNSPIEERNAALSKLDSISQPVQQYVKDESKAIADSIASLKRIQAAERAARVQA